MQSPEWSDQAVLVTGGADGIGESIVRSFHQQGARVFFCDVRKVAGRRLARELGSNARFQACDLRDEQQINTWIGTVSSETGTIRALVNNAAIDPRIDFDRMTSQQWDDLFAVNLRACFLTSQAAVRAMKPGAAIVNVGSITFHSGPARMSAYVATKGGVLAFTRSLARELGPRHIRVNAVSPGWIMTSRQLRQYITPAVRRLIQRSQSIPDLIQPEEIARVVLFLAGEASTAITGQEILADRGWMHS
jgi:D-xylose 1-dehydrogenase